MRMPGDIVFSVGALIMGWDFIVKLRRAAGTVALTDSGVRVTN
jgi:hypothetical protein